MKFDIAPALAAQLAELLEGVLKRGGHLDSAAKDLPALIEIARSVMEAAPRPDPVPVVIVSLEGGTIVESYGTHPARIIFMDGDTEGGDGSQVVEVFGEAKYLTDGMLDVRPHSVADVLGELAADAPEDEDDERERDTPRP